MSKKTEGRYEIGKIVAAHGVRGDMLILPLTDFPERFLEMKTLDLSLPGKPMRAFKVSRIAPYEGKGTFFVHLDEIGDREAAEALKGAAITVGGDERVELEEGEFWLDDIIGISVVDEATGEALGTVSEIIYTGSNDVYVVKRPDGKTEAIPALDDVVKSVDLAARTMKVTIPQGLWD